MNDCIMIVHKQVFDPGSGNYVNVTDVLDTDEGTSTRLSGVWSRVNAINALARARRRMQDNVHSS